ncbi:hypothetical protein HG530_001065 [Fusarium avenaceum]|nr:hypothetical protein HG530_001065 [Fusarium avenaceum]
MVVAVQWHHREDRDLLVGNNLQQSRAIGVDEPRQSLDNLIGLHEASALDVHGLSELDEIRVALVSMGVSILVEDVLPLCDHTLLLVVKNNDLDTNLELGSGGKLSQGHVEGSITVDVDDKSVRLGDLGTNGGGQTETHGSETTRCDHGSGMSPSEVLGGPHLMLANTSSDFLEVGGDVTLNGLSGLDNLVDVLRHNLEVDNATTTLSSGSLGTRGKLGNAQSDTIIESGTKGNDQISLLHGHVSISRAVHTEHVQGLLVEFVVGT